MVRKGVGDRLGFWECVRGMRSGLFRKYFGNRVYRFCCWD